MSLFDSASLVVTPNGYKAGKLYSIKPTSGAGDLNVVRATSATRVNASGLIEVVGNNIPRLDYTNASCPSILVEPQRTNLDPNSQTFNGWTLTNSGGVTVSNVNVTNPFGFSSVSKVIPQTTLGQHRPFLIANYSAVGRIWVIAKADGYNFLSLGEGGGVSGGSIIFNLLNGTISGSALGYTPEISSLGDGWYKCSLSMNVTGSGSRFIVIRNNNTINDYSGDGTSGILIAHKQLEVGLFDTSAIITSGTIMTRNADVISKTGISSLIGQTEGTIYIDTNLNVNTNERRLLTISNGTELQRIFVWTLSNLLYTTFNGVSVNLGNFPIGACKIAIGYTISGGSTTYGIKVNNNTIITGTVAVAPNPLNAFYLGSRTTVGLELNDRVNSALLFNTRLSNTELAQLTTL